MHIFLSLFFLIKEFYLGYDFNALISLFLFLIFNYSLIDTANVLSFGRRTNFCHGVGADVSVQYDLPSFLSVFYATAVLIVKRPCFAQHLVSMCFFSMQTLLFCLTNLNHFSLSLVFVLKIRSKNWFYLPKLFCIDVISAHLWKFRRVVGNVVLVSYLFYWGMVVFLILSWSCQLDFSDLKWTFVTVLKLWKIFPWMVSTVTPDNLGLEFLQNWYLQNELFIFKIKLDQNVLFLLFIIFC